MENLEELVDLSIQEITQPLDQSGTKYPITQVFPHYPPYSTPQVMVAANQPAWRAGMPLNLATPLHNLPKNLERVSLLKII